MWIESHQSLGSHRKLLKLSSILGINKVEAIGYLHFFWWWCLDNALDGKLDGLTAEIIAEVSRWNGDKKSFLEAMISSGFIDRDETSMTIHDWKHYTGKLLESRRNTRRRVREHRERNALLTRTKRERNANVTDYRTVPDHTVPKEKSKKVNGDANCSEISQRIDPEITGEDFAKLRAALAGFQSSKQ